MRRRKLLALAVLVLAGIAAFVLWPWPGATRANYDRIEHGTTLAEVEAVLGPPTADSELGRLSEEDFDERGEESECRGRIPPQPRRQYVWLGRAGRLAVAFNGGCVTDKEWLPRATLPQRLNRQWRRWLQ